MAELAEDCPRSEYACVFCKRRKVKCDRALPFCSICRRSRQECEYPIEVGKPGPKLGSTRGSRKRTSSLSPEARAVRSKAQERPRRTNVNATVTQNSTTITNLDGSAKRSTEAPEDDTEHYPLTPATSPLDVHTLAYIVHPSHDISSIDTAEEELLDVDVTGDNAAISEPQLVAHACSLLGITVEEMHKYLTLYFDNVTGVILFHQTSFKSKIQNIKSIKELTALLASMFSVSARFSLASEPASFDQPEQDTSKTGPSHSPHDFESLSQQYVDDGLLEYSDGPPSLCLVQALILLTFQQLTKGVRGRAWRRLGLCIRTAYELQLHHVDRDNFLGTTDVTAWCHSEERRRAWWAIWEMDIFASTIKRCPSGIDWTDIETRLPAPDEYWFERKIFQSCFLEAKPMDRVTALRRCGNESAKAWFLVLYSFMREGHVISKYRSAQPGNGRHNPARTSPKDTTKDTSDSLVILVNALKCFTMALPKQLRYQDEYLSFTSRDPSDVTTIRQLHGEIYSIHVTIQLTRFMIHHNDAFGGARQDLHLFGAANEGKQNPAPSESGPVSLHLGPTRKGLQQYMEAADELLSIVSRSSVDHVRYVNPLLASTIWYGAAVHLAWKVLAPPNLNKDLIHSKFEVLRMNFDEYTAFWDLTNALHENLQSMEEKLTMFKSCRNKRIASVRRHNQSKSNGRVVASVEEMNSSPKIQATEIETVAGDDSAAASLQSIYRPDFSNHADVNNNSSVMEFGGLQTSPRSTDAFNFDDLLTTDNSGQPEAPFFNSKTIWSDLGMDIEFAMNPHDFSQGLMDFNYVEE